MAVIDKAQALAGLLKERYPMLMYNTIVNRTEVLDLFNEESSAKVFDGPDGKYYKLSDLLGGLQGIGSRLEDTYLPVSGQPIVINPIVKMKYHYARVDFTYQAMVNANAGDAAFADFGTAVLLPVVENLTDDLDRQACGYAAGILARYVSTSGSTISIDRPFGLTGSTKGWLNVKAGMSIVFGPNADGSGLRSGGAPAKVLTVDPTGNSGGGTALLDFIPGDLAANDYIFRGDEQGANVPINGEEPEMMGIEGMVDNGTVLDTLQNVSRTTVSEWKSTVIDASAAPYSTAFTEGLALRLMTDARTIGGGKPSVVICSHDVGRQAYNAIRQLGGFAARRDAAQVAGGYKGVAFDTPMGPLEVRSVARIAPGRAYALDTSTLGRAKIGNGDWVDTFGGIFHQQQVGGAIKDAGFAYYRVPMQLFCTDPKKSTKATGISETAY